MAKRTVKKKQTHVQRSASPPSYLFENLIVGATTKLNKRTPSHAERPFSQQGSKKTLLPESLPTALHDNQATLLTVNSRFAFAYWKMNPETLAQSISHVGPTAKLFLRFYDLSTSLNLRQAPYWDVEVFDHSGNWYLRLEHLDQKLCFEVGLKDKRERFLSLMRSNIMQFGPRGFEIPSYVTPAAPHESQDPQLLKHILGPYFYELYEQGRLNSISNPNLEAIFHEVATLRHTKPSS